MPIAVEAYKGAVTEAVTAVGQKLHIALGKQEIRTIAEDYEIAATEGMGERTCRNSARQPMPH